MKRLITAAVLAPVLWAVCKYAPLTAIVPFLALFAAAASWEFHRMLEAEGTRPHKVIGLVATFAIAWSFSGLAPVVDTSAVLAALVVASFVAAMASRREPSAMLRAALGTVGPVVVVGLGLGHAVRLRAVPGENGPDLLFLLLVCVMFGDTAAYYVGRAFGRTRMAPVISPKKTWEGAAGAVAGSVGGAVLAHVWFFQRLTLGHALVLGVLLAVAGIAGDLAESVAKRATGVKDSSSLLPGHGGVFDRVDSLLFSSPLLYYYYRVILEGSV